QNSPYQVTATVSDGTGSISQTFAWTIDHLAVVNPGDQIGKEGSAASLQIEANTAAGFAVTYGAAGLPAGVTINSSTGLISGTLGTSAHGASPYQVTVSASHGGHTDSQSFIWSVTPQGVIEGLANQASAAADVISLPVAASTGTGNSLTFSGTGLPVGLTINSTTGLISGTIALTADSGSPYTPTLTVTDGTFSSSQTFTWTVTNVFVVAPGDQASTTEDVVSLAISARDANGDPLTYSAAGLPPGLAVNSATGLISGTVAVDADLNSPYTVTVTASDGTHSCAQSFTWAVITHIDVANPGDQFSVDNSAVSLAISASDPNED